MNKHDAEALFSKYGYALVEGDFNGDNDLMNFTTVIFRAMRAEDAPRTRSTPLLQLVVPQRETLTNGIEIAVRVMGNTMYEFQSVRIPSELSIDAKLEAALGTISALAWQSAVSRLSRSDEVAAYCDRQATRDFADPMVFEIEAVARRYGCRITAPIRVERDE